jgi:predicted permease
MDWHRFVRARLCEITGDAARDSDIVEELAQHMATRFDELLGDGVTEQEALDRLAAELKGPDPGRAIRRADRVRPTAPVQPPVGPAGLLRDARYAVRALARAPRFTAAVIATLGLAIGATIATFSVVSGVLIEPLPFPDSDRLIALVHRTPGAPGRYADDVAASPAFYFTYRDHSRTFASVALWFANTAAVTGAGDPEEVAALHATWELVPTLGVQPALGRAFTENDDARGGPQTVMLAHGYWQRRFGGARDIIGRSLIIDGAPHEVVGVLPEPFPFPQQPVDVIIPMRPVRARAYIGPVGERGIARLKDGVTLDEARADGRRMVSIMFETMPLAPWIPRARFDSVRLEPNFQPLKESFVGDLRDTVWVIMATISALLLIACANIANLLLVRAERRAHEIAVQAALGASRGTIARGLLLESTLLGLAGGAVGLLLARTTLPVLLALAASELPATIDVTIDSRVVVFALSISVAAGVLFGLLPVVRFAGPRTLTLIRDASRSHSTSRERHRARTSLVVAQVALALMLLVASGLMIRTFQSLRRVEPGFAAPGRVQIVRLSVPRDAASPIDRLARIQQDLQQRLSAIPGVATVAFASRLPLGASGPSGPFLLESRPDAAALEVEFRYVSPGLFETLGTSVRAGRDFEWADHYGTRQVAIASASFARREWGSPAAAIGNRMRRSAREPWIEVIGVVDDVRHDGLERPAPDTVYLPLSESLATVAAPRTAYFFLRTDRAGTSALVADVSKAVSSVSDRIPIGGVQTLGDLYSSSIARTSLTLVLLAVIGSMALLLGVIGVYAVISSMVAQRMREIGIRMVFGAQYGSVTRMFLRQGLRPVIIGVTLGLGGAVALAHLMESLLFGVAPLDLTTYVTTSVALVGAALLTIYFPVRRAVRFEPMRLCLRDGT